jgi:hypothetical protein
MKRTVLFLMIAQAIVIQAKHQIVTIYNRSDLKFEHAFSMSNGNLLPALTKRLQESSDKKKQHVVIEHTLGAEGLGIKMKDDSGKSVDLLVDGQATSNIEHGRKKSKKIKFPQSCKMADGPYCARAVMQDQKQNELASTCYAHKNEGDLLNLHISGSQEKYQLLFEPAA